MVTLNRSEKAATVVFVVLLGAVLLSALALWEFISTHGVALLVATAFIAFALILATAFIARKLWKAMRVLDQFGIPPARIWTFLSRRQWFTMLIGLISIVVSTGAFTGVSVMAADSNGSIREPSPWPGYSTATTTAAPWSPPPTSPPSPTASSESPASTMSADPSIPDSGSSTPHPGATIYLDNADPVAGYQYVGPVAFSAKRYPRSILIRSCDRSH